MRVEVHFLAEALSYRGWRQIKCAGTVSDYELLPVRERALLKGNPGRHDMKGKIT